MKDFNEIQFIDGLFACLKKNGVASFNEIELQEVINQKTNEKNAQFISPNMGIVVALGVSIFNNYGIVRKDNANCEITYSYFTIDNTIDKLSQSLLNFINEIALAYKRKFPQPMSLEQFIKLLFACLAENEEGKVHLPHCYQDIIEQIIAIDHDLQNEFGILINLNQYGLSSIFSMALAYEIENYVATTHKKVTYNFKRNTIDIDLPVEERKLILSNYDEKTLSLIRHFCDLLIEVSKTETIKKDVQKQKTLLF